MTGRGWGQIGRALALMAGAALLFEAGGAYLLWLEAGRNPIPEGNASASPGGGTPGGEAVPFKPFTTKIHPYFGFVHDYTPSYAKDQGMLINNFGFSQRADYAAKFPFCCDFPLLPEKHPDIFLVGVFGNSIARGVADAMQTEPEVQRRLSALPEAQGKQVLVLNLSIGGHRQPQALLILTYLLSVGMKFDLVLFLGSSNEAVAGAWNADRGESVAFPVTHTWTTLTHSLEQMSDTGDAALLSFLFRQGAQRTQARLTRCWLAACVVLNRGVLKVQTALAGALGGTGEIPPEARHFMTDPTGPEAVAGDGVPGAIARSWLNACRLMAAAVRQTGGRFIEVLMPNPWVHPSGRNPPEVSSEEIAEESAFYKALMPWLVTANATLQAEGVHAVDATRLMNDRYPNDMAVFKDHYGHLGTEGMARVVALLLAEIQSHTSQGHDSSGRTGR